MCEKGEYLKLAISDCQAIIRAIDIKAGFMLVVLMSPIYYLDKYWLFVVFVAAKSLLGLAILCLAFVCWSMAIWSLFMCIAAISNPVEHVPGDKPVGTYYGGYLFIFNMSDVFLNKKMKAKYSVAEDIVKIPSDENGLLAELTFERIKLSYIRDIKTKRIQYCVRFAFYCVCMVVAECVLSFVGTV